MYYLYLRVLLRDKKTVSKAADLFCFIHPPTLFPSTHSVFVIQFISLLSLSRKNKCFPCGFPVFPTELDCICGSME